MEAIHTSPPAVSVLALSAGAAGQFGARLHLSPPGVLGSTSLSPTLRIPARARRMMLVVGFPKICSIHRRLLILHLSSSTGIC